MSETAAPQLTSDFDRATAVTPGPRGSYDATIDPGFTVGPKPNGGYLLALGARAIAHALEEAGSNHRDPLALTAHFVRAPDPGPATITVDVLRTGRGASQACATIEQGATRCVELTATVGTLPDQDATATWLGLAPPSVAPIEQCLRVPADPPGGAFTVSIMERTDLRLDPATMRWAFGEPQGTGELRGWISLADGRPADPYALLFFLDALPPATFDIGRSGWVPTLSLTTYLRARPAPGPLRVVQRAQAVADGRVDEVCELWDRNDRLVGQATQLAAIRFEEGALDHLQH